MDDARCKEPMVPITVTCYIQHGQYSNEYTEFAVVGAGTIGRYIVQKLLKNLNKAAGIVKKAIILICQVPHLSNIQCDATVIKGRLQYYPNEPPNEAII